MPEDVLQWPDWLNLGSSVAQAVIAFFGFAIAIYELRRTRGVAESTRLLTLTQSLRAAERNLDDAKSRSAATRALNDWRAIATEAHGVLVKLKAPKALLDGIEDSRRLAAQAKSDIQSSPVKTNLATGMEKVRRAVAQACDDVAQFISGIE